MMLLILTCCIGMTLAAYTIKPPIPVEEQEPGMHYNPAAPPPRVQLEMFIDLHCPDSNNAWPIIKSVQDHYSNYLLDVVVHQLPLVFHRNALLATQGLFVVQQRDPTQVVDYMEANLQSAANFSTSATSMMTDPEVLDMLADLAYTATGIAQEDFKNDIDSFLGEAIVAWKYGVRRGVGVTPSYFLNGVELGIGTSIPEYDDWIAFLDPIIFAP